MKITSRFVFFIVGFYNLSVWGFAQPVDSAWTLDECISQALENNIQLQQMQLVNETQRIDILKAKAARYPSASASATQNFAWSRETFSDNSYGPLEAGNNTNFGISSGVTLYNGFKINNTVQQAEINYRAGQFDNETLKDDLRLQVLDAYLQVLYTTEAVTNSTHQIEVTAEELRLAGERLTLGAISRSDYTLIKAQLADEKLSLINAENQLTLNKLNLMQLMEIPVSDPINLRLAPLDTIITGYTFVNSDSVYSLALQFRPEIKSAELNLQSTSLDINLARAGAIPSLSLQGSLSTGYSSTYNDISYNDQFRNRVNPAIGLSLSIPLYQNRQVRSQVETAYIGVRNAELDMANTKNQLRKTIEQACTDVSSAVKEYEASIEKYQAQQESFQLSLEKFNQGLINSVDFLYEKTNLIVAESNVLQSKYKLIYSIRILDFYKGKSLTE